MEGGGGRWREEEGGGGRREEEGGGGRRLALHSCSKGEWVRVYIQQLRY